MSNKNYKNSFQICAIAPFVNFLFQHSLPSSFYLSRVRHHLEIAPVEISDNHLYSSRDSKVGFRLICHA